MRKIINTAICLLLVLAMTVPAFADTSQGTATTLKLEKTEGKVNITKSAGKSVTVKDGIRLYDGYTVKTDKNSKAYVSLDQSKAIMLDASTTCSIKKSGKKLEIMLQSGTVLVNVEDKLAGDEELNIRTTNSVTGIRGTIAQFTFNSTTQNTEVYLFEGRTTGTYLAPDGSWYTQELVSGSWLASGRGMLSDHPEYNGWTKQEDGTWLYTNNNINSPKNARYFWGENTGWFMKDAMTGETDTRTAWPFTFPMLEPAVQKEIINDESMLKRGQEHLDLYPELAEKKLEDTKKAADESLIAKTEEAEKRDETIQELYDEGTASVDNLFKDTAPSVPTYAVRYYKTNDLTELLQTRYFEEGEAVDQPTDLIKGYTITGWSMQDPDSGTYIPVTTMGTVVIDCWPAGVIANEYTLTIHNETTTATVNTNAIPTGTDTYTVTFDDAVFEFTLTTTVPTGSSYTVRDANNKYYAAQTGTYSIPINEEGNIDIYIADAVDTHAFIILMDLASVEISGYSGKVVSFDKNAGGTGYDIVVEGTDGVDVELYGKEGELGKKGIAEVYDTDASTEVTAKAGTYNGYSGTYHISGNSEVTDDYVYNVIFAGNTNTYTVTNAISRNGNTYTFVGEPKIKATVAASADVLNASMACLITSDGLTDYFTDFSLNDEGIATIYLSSAETSQVDIYYSASGMARLVVYKDAGANFVMTDSSNAIAAYQNAEGTIHEMLMPLGSTVKFTTTGTILDTDNVTINNDGVTYTVTVEGAEATINIE